MAVTAEYAGDWLHGTILFIYLDSLKQMETTSMSLVVVQTGAKDNQVDSPTYTHL